MLAMPLAYIQFANIFSGFREALLLFQKVHKHGFQLLMLLLNIVYSSLSMYVKVT